MPNYDFHCKDCGHEFEQIVPFDHRDDERECPACGKKTVARAISAASVNYTGKSMYKRAGDGWKEVQDRIKSASAKRNTIRTK